MEEKNDTLRPLRANPHIFRVTYELFNRLREGMILEPLCVGIGIGSSRFFTRNTSIVPLLRLQKPGPRMTRCTIRLCSHVIHLVLVLWTVLGQGYQSSASYTSLWVNTGRRKPPSKPSSSTAQQPPQISSGKRYKGSGCQRGKTKAIVKQVVGVLSLLFYYQRKSPWWCSKRL